MISAIGFVLFFIFSVLALIHFYWAFGGTKGLDSALPKTKEGKRSFTPGIFATLTVGLGLSAVGIFFLIKTEWMAIPLPSLILQFGSYVIGGIFIFRGIGDFKYSGIFKKITDTDFAKADTRYFTPLCWFLGTLSILTGVMC